MNYLNGNSKVSFENGNIMLPPYKKEKVPRDVSVLPKKCWKKLIERDGRIILPARKADEPHNAIPRTTVSVNKYITKLIIPNPLYRYDISVERITGEETTGRECILTKHLAKTIIQTVVDSLREEYPHAGIITDLVCTLATAVKVLPDVPLIIEFTRDSNVNNGNGTGGIPQEDWSEFNVKITPNLVIDTTDLNKIINDMKGQVMPGNTTHIEAIYGMLMRNMGRNYTKISKTGLIDFTEAPRSYIGGGVMILWGYNVMMPLSAGWKPFINIELANFAAYLDGPVLTVIQKVLEEMEDATHRLIPADATNMESWRQGDWGKVDNFVNSCKVKYIHNPSVSEMWTKTVGGLCPKSVSQTTFLYRNRGIVSVFDFFTKYRQPKIPLQYPNGPCLELKGGSKPKVPAEICFIQAGQSFSRRKLTGKQILEIRKVTKLKPSDPYKHCGGLYPAIQKSVEELGFMDNEYLRTYGVQLATGQMHQVEAKILGAPVLVYGKKIQNESSSDEKVLVTPKYGSWDIWSSRFEFYRTVKDPKWAIVNLAIRPDSNASRRQATCMHFANKLIKIAKQRGIELPQPAAYREASLPDSMDSHTQNVEILRQTFSDTLNDIGEEDSFALIVLPRKGCSLYKAVKQAAEIHVRLLTQCIVANSLNQEDESVGRNILLKIHSKLTYVNHVIIPPARDAKFFKIFDYPTIILGIDVTHPTPGSGKQMVVDGQERFVRPPSFAAITASICRTGMPFAMHIQAQTKPGKGAAEIIQGLDEVVKKLLWMFYNFTGHQPVKIICFRDGVGNSQFQEVLHMEMTAIRRACTNLNKNYTPSITFITVQKRHKTRFFVPTGNECRTALPGTVVDTDVVHQTETDFYLQSHLSVVGTSRPTRYHVLWDDSDFSMTEIQTMAYYLCYMYVRCNRSVSIPAPTYYAHWAAKRAKLLSEGWGEKYYADQTMDRLNAELEVGMREITQQYPMHFV